LRDYLAKKAGVSGKREFFLLKELGRDLPGAVTILESEFSALTSSGKREKPKVEEDDKVPLRFSLAGVQFKFSAVKEAAGGLTIPAEGRGGSWIIKLPSMTHESVPENEFAMMQLAGEIGIEVPEVDLISVNKISGLPKEIPKMKDNALAVRLKKQIQMAVTLFRPG
jgi:serine/threonine-protein kinase HipA